MQHNQPNLEKNDSRFKLLDLEDFYFEETQKMSFGNTQPQNSKIEGQNFAQPCIFGTKQLNFDLEKTAIDKMYDSLKQDISPMKISKWYYININFPNLILIFKNATIKFSFIF